jgi:diadenylate cyclase
MQLLENFWNALYSVIKGFGIFDLLDIIIISYIVYKAFKIVRETRAEQLLKGILLLCVAYLAANLLQLKTVEFLLTNVFQIGILALIVLFQPELRRVLERVGRTKVSHVFGSDSADKNAGEWSRVIPVIVEAVQRLSKSTTGALIVIERQTRLGEQIATGVELNAKPSVELFGNIFFVNTPLHDGAVIMRDGRILAAACFLPKPQKEELIATHLGSRHRAAIGISEVSDSITIVVSEETGTVSIAEDGKLQRGFTSERLANYLRDKLVPQVDKDSKKRPFLKGKKK